MAFTNYDLVLTDDYGRALASLNSALAFSASQTADGFGEFKMVLPRTFDDTLINRENVRDRMVQIWRRPQGLWRVYFVRHWLYSTDDRGRDSFTIAGPDTKDLLRRRIVAAYTAAAQSSKTDCADDMMKEIMTEALADGVAPVPSAGTRAWPNFSVGADVSLGPTLTRDFAFKTLATPNHGGILPMLQEASLVAGNEVFFDVLVDDVGPPIKFIFETSIDQPGKDKTTGANRVVFSQESGNLKNPSLEYDYSEEVNYSYGLGQGEGSARNVQQVGEAARYLASQWNRCEASIDARNQGSNNGVREKARQQVREGRARVKFGGDVIDTSTKLTRVFGKFVQRGVKFGEAWDYGDKVIAQYRNVSLEVIIRSVMLNVNQDGRETVNARLNFEGVV